MPWSIECDDSGSWILKHGDSEMATIKSLPFAEFIAELLSAYNPVLQFPEEMFNQ